MKRERGILITVMYYFSFDIRERRVGSPPSFTFITVLLDSLIVLHVLR